MKRISHARSISAGALLVGMIVLSGVAIAMEENNQPKLIASGSIAQIDFEMEVAAFLTNSPEPQSEDFDYSIEGRNSYWRAMAAWWDAVPWNAVAGQWGCTSQAGGATFNPPDEQGVITAGYGGTGNCSGAEVGKNPAIFSIPKTRSTIVSEFPLDFN